MARRQFRAHRRRRRHAPYMSRSAFASAAGLSAGALLFLALSFIAPLVDSHPATSRGLRSPAGPSHVGGQRREERSPREAGRGTTPQRPPPPRVRRRSLQQSPICSCAPRAFTVTLDLLNDCLDDTFEANGGIARTDCLVQVGNPDDAVAAAGAEDEADPAAPPRPTVEQILATIPWVSGGGKESKSRPRRDGERSRRTDDRERNRKKGDRDRLRRLQGGGPSVPEVVVSVTFIEIDADGVVIGVNDQFTNVEFTTGSSFRLESVSGQLALDVPLADQLDLVPSTVVLFMIGINEDGEEVRGRFVLQYTNSCDSDGVAVRDGDVLAWSEWTDMDEQETEFCPANAGGTGTPTDESPDTLGPTVSQFLHVHGDPWPCCSLLAFGLREVALNLPNSTRDFPCVGLSCIPSSGFSRAPGCAHNAAHS